jgi:Tol biopolymer transport system component
MPLSIGAGSITLAPNDRQAAVLMQSQSQPPNTDVWIVELARGIASRFTFTDVSETGPVWSPDASRIAFRTSRDGAFDLFVKEVNGTADEVPLTTPRSPGVPTDWSPDGRFLLFARFAGPTDADLFIVPLETKVPMPLLQTPFAEQAARMSPDGRSIAYLSNESGATEIYRPFTVVGGKPGLGGKWRVSTDGATSMNWRGDGRELFYRNRSGALMVVDVVAKEGGVLETGNPRQLFMPPDVASTWDVTSDGQRFLLNVPSSPGQTEQRPPDPMTVVLNWQTALQKK